MKTSRPLVMLLSLLWVFTCGSGMVWAERDRGHHVYRNDDPYKQRPLNFTAEEQRPIIAPHGFSTRPTRDWERDGDRRYRARDDYRDNRHDDYYRRTDNRYDDRRNNGIYQNLYDNRRDDSGNSRYRGQRPVNDVIREVQNRYDGQVIGVQNGDGGMYRVRVLQRDGRVKNVMVPAE